MGLAGKAALAGAGFALGAAVVACAACPMIAKRVEGCIREKRACASSGMRVRARSENNEELSSPVENTDGQRGRERRGRK